jgi:heme/copper-type cytochrome/quinol oxidase subunit 2
MSTKAIIITLIIALVGAGYLMLALLGPLKDANFGLGLTAGLSAQKIAGGYSMANVVMFIVFLVVIGVAFFVWKNQGSTKGQK